jgi:pimeloyl-ACP methyl ester carboxylesterase
MAATTRNGGGAAAKGKGGGGKGGGKKSAAASSSSSAGPLAIAATTAKLLLLIAVLAAVLPWDPTLTPGPMLAGAPPHSPDVVRPVRASDNLGYSRQIVRFPCGPLAAATTLGRTPPTHPNPDNDVSCEAWLYIPEQGGPEDEVMHTPDSSTGLPIMLMAHGMGGQRDMGLDRFARSFVLQARVAVLAFDYRTFGGSEGEPRNWASPWRHVEDWASAYAHVTSGGLGSRIDKNNVAFWGTSFAGGHSLVLASKLADGDRGAPLPKAIISLVPHLSGPAAARASIARRGLLQSIRMISAGLQDRLREALGFPPAYLKLVGPPGSTAVMQLDSHERAEYFSKHPKIYHGGWRNLVRARLTLEMGRYSPIDYLPKVNVPVLMIAATNDTLCPIEQVRRAPTVNPRVMLLLRDCTHFELYRGQHFDAVINAQVSLMRQVLWGEEHGERPAAAFPTAEEMKVALEKLEKENAERARKKKAKGGGGSGGGEL